MTNKNKLNKVTGAVVISFATVIALSAAILATNIPQQNNTKISQAATAPYKNGTLSGYVTFDTNNNFAFDASDSPAAGFSINANGNDNYGNTVSGSAVTDATGKYVISNLPDGTYQLSFLQTDPNYLVYDKTGSKYDGITTDQVLTLTGGQVSSVTDINWGFQSTPIITTPAQSGTVTTGTPTVTGTGQAGATVTLYEGATALTTNSPIVVDSSGNWTGTLTNALSNGSHAINAMQTFAIDSNPANNLISDHSADTTFTVNISATDTTAPAAPAVTTVDGKSFGGSAVTTTNPKPVITGTSEAGATIKIKDPSGNLIGSGVVDAQGNYSITPTVALPEGTSNLSVTSTDPAGNTSTPTAVPVKLDTTAPSAPTVNPANASATTLSGTGEAGATVTVKAPNGSTVCTAVVDASGNWSCPVSGLTNGQVLTVTQADPAGNVSAPTTITVTNTPDTVAPSAPLISVPASNSTTTSTQPNIGGNGEPNATLTVKDGTTLIGTTTVLADGSWTLTPASPLSQGSHTITATQADPSGNISPVSNSVTFTVDTNAAAAPTINPLPAITPSNQANYPVSGTCVTGNTVKIIIGTLAPVSVPCTNGAFSTTINVSSLPDSTNVPVKANQTGANGVPSADVTASVVKDTTAPSAPTVNPANASATTLSGTGESGATVTVKAPNGSTVCTAVVNASGTWSCPVSGLTNGQVLTATQTDPAGNVSAPTTVTVTNAPDTVAPSAPVITTPANNSSTTNAQPTISGTGEVGATVTVKEGTTVIGTAVVGSNGSWTLTPTTALSQGSHTITATQADVAGNVSPVASSSFTVSPTPPVPPTIYSNGTISGYVTTDTNGDGSYQLGETPMVGISVNLNGSDNYGNTIGKSAITDTTGKYTITGLPDGTYDLLLLPTNGETLVYDKTGSKTDGIISNQILTLTGTQVSTINDANFGFAPADTVAPIAPMIKTPTNGSVSNNARPVITGTGEPNAIVTVKDGATLIGTTTVLADGSWTLTPTSPLSQGSHTITATQMDQAGNISPVSNSVTFTVDTNAAAAPTVNPLPAITPANQASYPVSGTCVTGNTVKITIGTITKTVTCDNGVYSTTLDVSSIPDSTNVPVKVNQTGANGIPSADATASVVKDTTAPTAPVIATPTNNSSTANTKPTISGAGEVGATVTVKEGTTVIGTAKVDANGNWSLTPATAFTAGSHTITATQSDVAGNVSPASTVMFTVQIANPVTPTPVATTTATQSVVTINPAVKSSSSSSSVVSSSSSSVSSATTTTVRTGGANILATILSIMGVMLTGTLFFFGFKRKPKVDIVNK
jgi:large repetitive protein